MQLSEKHTNWCCRRQTNSSVGGYGCRDPFIFVLIKRVQLSAILIITLKNMLFG